MMTRKQLEDLLDKMGATADTALDFFTEKVAYGAVDTDAEQVSRTFGLHQKAVYVKTQTA